MAIKGKRSDEGGSGAERKGRVPNEAEESREAGSPYGETDIARDLEELENEARRASPPSPADSSRRREEIAANPDNEEELAEDALAASSEEEDESQTHDRRRH